MQLMATMDGTIAIVALPRIQNELGLTDAGRSWVITAYVLTFGGLMLLGGRLGDTIGRKRTFTVGVALFTIASALCGIAWDDPTLVIARLLQGVGAAIATPTGLALIATTFAKGPARNAATAVFGAMAGVGSVMGLVVGGALTEISWRLAFLVNVPIGLLAALAAWRVLEHRAARSGAPRARLDIPSAAGVTASLAPVLVPLALGRTTGWPAWTWACMACGLAAAGLTGYWQRTLRRRGGQPVLETTLFRLPTYAAGAGASVAFLAYFASFMFTLTLMLQGGFGLTPFRGGLAFAPMGVMFSITALLGRPLVARYGQRVVGVGCAIIAAGLILFTVHPGLALVIAAAGMVGTGNGLVLPQLVGTALTQVPSAEAGVGSGMLTTAQQFAGSAGVTLIGTVFFSVLGTDDYAGAARATAIIYLALIALVAALVALIAVRVREAPGSAAVHRDRQARPAAQRSRVPAQAGDPPRRHHRSAMHN